MSERTGGVPLFVEEVTRLLLERGEQGGAQAIPPTLQQSLAARLDRLGAARETAQIGAVLGRGFSYALLQSVAGLDEGALQSALERLAEADILFVEGDGAQATYRFKHALIQDAAYDSLLKSRRQALHARAAEILRDSASPEPEAIAHHFTQAGLDDLAIEWWGKAGDQALRRSAFQEAIAHLGKAIAMADKAARRRSRRQVVSPLRTGDDAAARGLWQRAHRGARPRRGGNDRSLRQGARVGVWRQGRAERLAADYGLWVGSHARGELAIDEGARGGLPQRRRGETRLARGRRRPSRRRDHLLVRRRVSRSAGSSGTRARLVPTRPRRRSGLSLRTGRRRRTQWPIWRLRRGLSARSIARVSLIDRMQARIAGLTHVGTLAYGQMHRGHVRTDAWRPCARRAECL